MAIVIVGRYSVIACVFFFGRVNNFVHFSVSYSLQPERLIIYSTTYNRTIHVTVAGLPQQIQTKSPKHGKVRVSNDNSISTEYNINPTLRNSP